MAIGQQLLEELLSQLPVPLPGRARVVVEREVECTEQTLVLGVKVVDKLSGAFSHQLGCQGNCHSVFVRAGDEEHIVATQPLIAGIGVRRQIGTRQVPKMGHPVGVEERGGN